MDKKYCAYLCSGCGIGEALDMEALAEVVTGEMSMECKNRRLSVQFGWTSFD